MFDNDLQALAQQDIEHLQLTAIGRRLLRLRSLPHLQTLVWLLPVMQGHGKSLRLPF